MQTLSKLSKHLAQDLGAALTAKLAHLVDGGNAASVKSGNNIATGYTLNFNGFSYVKFNLHKFREVQWKS